jgi:hypothetical protein
VVLYGQYVLDRKLVRRGRRSKKVAPSDAACRASIEYGIDIVKIREPRLKVK